MGGNTRRAEILLLAAGMLLLAGIGVAAWRFASIDRLATFEDDSVSYLLLAQCWSPWHPVREVVRLACVDEHYPPLFPALLALTGASHSFLLAHRAAVALFVLAVLANLAYAQQQLRWTPASILLALLFACAPVTWTQMLSIGSENLYIVMTLATLALWSHLHRKPTHSWRDGLLLGVVLAGVPLTRAIGVSMVAAMALLWCFHRPRRWRLELVAVATATVLVIPAYAMRRFEGESLYTADIRSILFGLMGMGPLEVIDYVEPQARQIYREWFGFFTNYRIGFFDPPVLIGHILGIASLAGIALRLRLGRLDAWYSLIYLGILLFWHLPGQFPRFLYAIGCVLLLQAAWFIHAAAQARVNVRRARQLLGFTMAVALAAAAPALAFFHERARTARQLPGLDLASNAEFYRSPDLHRAIRRATESEMLFEDITRLGELTRADETILWFTPSFIALLADRQGVMLYARLDDPAAPWAGSATSADYVFLSRLHPRDTRAQVDGMRLQSQFLRFANPVVTRAFPDGSGRILSQLLRFDPEKLDREFQGELPVAAKSAQGADDAR